MQRIRIRKDVEIKNLPWVPPQITLDALGRVSLLRYDYQNVRVEYTVTWQGETNILDTYTRQIFDA